jgi:hypothetical protein
LIIGVRFMPLFIRWQPWKQIIGNKTKRPMDQSIFISSLSLIYVECKLVS